MVFATRAGDVSEEIKANVDPSVHYFSGLRMKSWYV